VYIRDLSSSSLILWALLASACSPDKPGDSETGSDTAGDTAPNDTGDEPIPDAVERYDGAYTGEFEATLTMEGLEGMSDSCIGTSLVGISGQETVPLQGTAPCAWQGLMESMFPDWSEPAAHFEGSVTEEGAITAGINFGPVQDVVTGTFDTDTTFSCAFEGTFEFTPDQLVLYEGRLTGEVVTAGE